MKFRGTLKLKSILLITVSVLLSIFLMYNFSKEFYLHSDEKQLKTYISGLLTEIGEDLDHIEESLDWTLENLNLTFYVRDDVEHLLNSVTSNIDNKKVLSDSDIQQLERGNTVINKIKTQDFALDLLLFIHPIIENNEIEKLLFVHVPANNMEGSEGVFAGLTTLLAILSIGITMMITMKIFGKSYR